MGSSLRRPVDRRAGWTGGLEGSVEGCWRAEEAKVEPGGGRERGPGAERRV